MFLKINNIFAYEVLDSRGNPTIACIAKLSCGLVSKAFYSAKAMVPSGASTGTKEALELRDHDKSRYLGKGVKKAVHYVNYVIAPSLIENGIDPSKQPELDQFLIDLDGTEDKSRYGANAMLAVSLAIAKAVAKSKRMPFYQYVAYLVGNSNPTRFVLPLPMVNVINGGAHADNTIDFQEFMFMPVGASSIHEAIRISAECFHHLASHLQSKGLNTGKGDEGGFAPNLSSTEDALVAMMIAIEKAGYKPGVINGNVAIALDCAASELYDKTKRVYKFKKMIAAGLISETEGTKTTKQMIEYYTNLVENFPIISIEDPLDESDLEGFAALTEKLGNKIQIVGDDLYCTNPRLTQDGVEKSLTNSILIKVNQIGTLSETLKTMQIAKNAGWTCILSHRSGETEDTTIADIAVGTSSGQIKTGSMSRSERIAKYNRLLEIEIELTAANSTFYGLYSLFSLDFKNTELFKIKNYLIDSNKGTVKCEVIENSPEDKRNQETGPLGKKEEIKMDKELESLDDKKEINKDKEVKITTSEKVHKQSDSKIDKSKKEETKEDLA